MTDKKDLTRIEDMGEFLHEIAQEAELPELPPVEETEEQFFESTQSPPTEDAPIDFGEFTMPEESIPDTNFSSMDHFTSSTDDSPFELTASEPDAIEQNETLFEEPKEEKEVEFEPVSQFEDYHGLTPELGPEAEPVKSIIESAYKAPENFSDLKQFAESSSFTGMSAEGNPSFSVLVKNIRFIEDVNDIMILLKELGLTSDSEEQLRSRLMRGTLLVPRISEYAAILLAHKLRRFDIDIQVGLSDEIHPPKHTEAPEVGMVSKHNLYQNQSHHFNFDDPKIEISQIIVAATPGLEGHQVVRYLGVASEHKMLDGHLVEDEASPEIPRYYQELAQKLKAHALKSHANAVVGLNYQLTPLPSEYGTTGSKYRLTCTGNLVWVNKL